jgi:AcrR family transcriptional regulator
MSPRTPKQFEEMREEKKTLIMDVALEHFAKEGYHSTTITQIAKNAGISKGLMYNYFDSKESLLSEIIMRSVKEGYKYFDKDRDGHLTEEEFEFFVRKIWLILKEKKSFWRLVFQLLMQNDVREKFISSFFGKGSLSESSGGNHDVMFLSNIVKIFTDYFTRKKERIGSAYDPYLDMNMFIITMKGFGMTYVYMENEDDEYYERTINAIIDQYK